jgi:chemotaxis regulatin CheY-phosphate phosphatase CheZ
LCSEATTSIEQREELKSKWRSWLERKISSETNRDHVTKWEQLLYNNHSSNPDLENNEIVINKTEGNVDTDKENFSTL